MVLLYDMLFGKGIQCGGPWKKAMKKHKVEILKCLEGAKQRMKPVTQKGTHVLKLTSIKCHPLTTDDVFWHRQTLAACYQLVQSILKIGSSLAERVG